MKPFGDVLKTIARTSDGEKDMTTSRKDTIAKETFLPGQEVAGILRRLARGELEARLLDARINWDAAYASDVGFEIGGYQIIFFNDCDELDYVDWACAPDGREAEFDDWEESEEPVQLLSKEEQSQVHEKLKAAR